MIIPLTIESSTSEQLNDFFDSDLTFTQTSLNKNKNLIEESEGIFKRLEDNSIVIEISTPFRENYFIDKNKILTKRADRTKSLKDGNIVK